MPKIVDGVPPGHFGTTRYDWPAWLDGETREFTADDIGEAISAKSLLSFAGSARAALTALEKNDEFAVSIRREERGGEVTSVFIGPRVSAEEQAEADSADADAEKPAKKKRKKKSKAKAGAEA